MALFTEDELEKSGRSHTIELSKSANAIVLEERNQPLEKTYDIFLSHSYLDKYKVLGIKDILNKLKYTVYIDWIEDEDLDRRKVNKKTAELIKHRMKNCKGMFFATSVNSYNSKWMPWECGYFDGLKQKVAILPVSISHQSIFNGQEYLGLYPFVDKMKDNEGNETIWINDDAEAYVNLTKWLEGVKPIKRKILNN